MAALLLFLAAIVGNALAIPNGALSVRMTERAATDRLCRWSQHLPRWLGVAGMGMVRTASQQGMQSNCRSRQDGDDAVQHELSESER